MENDESDQSTPTLTHANMVHKKVDYENVYEDEKMEAEIKTRNQDK